MSSLRMTITTRYIAFCHLVPELLFGEFTPVSSEIPSLAVRRVIELELVVFIKNWIALARGTVNTRVLSLPRLHQLDGLFLGPH
jgi:hypothetical protein